MRAPTRRIIEKVGEDETRDPALRRAPVEVQG